MTPQQADDQTKKAEKDLPDTWLDARLKALYQSVLEEPLPEDMLKRVKPPKQRPS